MAGPIVSAAVQAVVLLVVLSAPADAGVSRRLLQTLPRTLTGRAIVLAKDFYQQPSQQILALRTANGRQVHVKLNDSSMAAGILTGMDLTVTGVWSQELAGSGSVQAAGSGPGSAVCFTATSITASGSAPGQPRMSRGASGAVAAAGTSKAAAAATIALSTNELITSAINTLIIPISGLAASRRACPGTSPPKLTADQVKAVVFEEANPDGQTVGSTFNKCSYGKSKLTAANSRVTDLVELPCTGTSNGVPWTFSKCDFDDFNGWADAAEAALANQRVPLQMYKYRVYLLPPGACPFVGLAFVGCDGTPGLECRAWISGDYWDAPQTIVHEIGHNLFLGHAGSTNADGWFDQYNDMTCAMGYCCTNRCFNTPHAWQMGWISAQEVDGSSLKPGQTLVASLTSQSIASRSGLRINPSWADGVDPIFLGFRTKAGGDAGLGPDVANRVHVYSAPSTSTYDAKQTTLKASLSGQGFWEDTSAAVVVRVRALLSTRAAVSICRKGGAETAESCAAERDNDCNGLAGRKDPACIALQRKLSKTTVKG